MDHSGLSAFFYAYVDAGIYIESRTDFEKALECMTYF